MIRAMKMKFATILLAGVLFASPVLAQIPPTQCVTNALAGGTVDALTVPLLPCGLATNLLILTLSGTNTVSSPTLQMAGFPALPILTSAGGAPGVGSLSGVGTVVVLTGTGSSWLLVAGVNVTFPVSVPNGGTGVATITGMVKGNGTAAFSAGTAGTDFVAPGTATNFTAKQTFSGAAGVLSAAFKNIVEPGTVSATVATGTINYDLTTQSIIYYTSNASANWTVNFRGNGSNSLDSLMSTGDTVTAVFEVTQGGTAYYNSAVTIDGGAVTPKWQGGTAPSAGNVSSVDTYTYSITKTAGATFTVLASQTQFK